MCGRYVIATSPEEVAERFSASLAVGYAPSFNVAPSHLVPVIRARSGERVLERVQWGLVPDWAVATKGPRGGRRLQTYTNARSETAPSKRSFRRAWKEGRCLLPADGFYEWKKTAGGKQAYYFRLQEGGPFCMAGIHARWTSPEGDSQEGVCILTTSANENVASVHHRMPVLLHPDHHELWLSDLTHDGLLRSLMQPVPAGTLEAFPVSNRVNSTRENDASLVLPKVE